MNRPEQTSAPAWKPLPPEQWPDIWRERLEKTRKGRIGWTYWNLGRDLLAPPLPKNEKPDNYFDLKRKARGEFFRKLFKDLAYPPGTHIFWPIAMPPDGDFHGEPIANEQIFWSGLHWLSCRGVVIFGSTAATPALRKEKLQPMTRELKNGNMAWIMWDLDGLIEKPEKYGRALGFLRQGLYSIFRP